MKVDTYHLEFITPCFCAGANQAVAELRAPSIRGKLRWWFRILGGGFADEARVFGSVAGDAGQASALVVRVPPVVDRKKWQPMEFSGRSNTGYLLYFAKASGNGVRWTPTGAWPERTNFALQLLWRHEVPAACKQRFDLALDCFLMLGSFGLRSSRGLGCFHCLERPFSEQAFNKLLERIKKSAPGFLVHSGAKTNRSPELFDALGAQLRGLRDGYSAGTPGHGNPTPLGSSNPRQASAVYLRPVLLEGGNQCQIIVFEAPAEKVLGPESRRRAPRLRNELPAPATAPPARHNR